VVRAEVPEVMEEVAQGQAAKGLAVGGTVAQAVKADQAVGATGWRSKMMNQA
jgi:hypothetical protein